MPMAGKGMLLTSMNVDANDEAEFNRWYDREHLEERVAIEGFLEARRYVAHEGNPKYLSLYSTETFEVLDSPAYRTALANQTAWSKANIARFQNMIRAVARITVSLGTGRGAALGIVRLRPPSGGEAKLRAALREQLDPARLDGIISMHLIESDPALSKPITDESVGPQSRRRRLVRADRRYGRWRGPARGGAVQRQCRAQAAADHQRHLQADVGCRKGRPRRLGRACRLPHRTCCTATSTLRH